VAKGLGKTCLMGTAVKAANSFPLSQLSRAKRPALQTLRGTRAISPLPECKKGYARFNFHLGPATTDESGSLHYEIRSHFVGQVQNRGGLRQRQTITVFARPESVTEGEFPP